MSDRAALLEELCGFCRDNGIFRDGVEIDPDLDLIDSGLMDSMGLATLQAWIQERYGLEIAPEVFLMELRTLSALSRRLADTTP